jgi:hypothetical protein
MASGVAFHGGVAPCYKFWHNYNVCYVSRLVARARTAETGRGPADESIDRECCVMQREAEKPQECRLQYLDFYECLHRNKHKVRIVKALTHAHEEASGAGDGGGHHH